MKEMSEKPHSVNNSLSNMTPSSSVAKPVTCDMVSLNMSKNMVIHQDSSSSISQEVLTKNSYLKKLLKTSKICFSKAVNKKVVWCAEILLTLLSLATKLLYKIK